MKRFALLVLAGIGFASGLCGDDKPTADATTEQTALKPDTSVSSLRELPLHEHPTLLKMLKRNNELRARVGLRPHRLSPALTRAAQNHANYMARTGDFNHYSNRGPDGRAADAGYRGGVLENIAHGYSDVETAFSGWQSSGAHWSNMTSGTADAGFGYQIGANGAAYWVAIYSNGKDTEKVVVDVAEASNNKPSGEKN